MDNRLDARLGATTTAPDDDDCPVRADQALARLMEGNARFLRGEPRTLRAPKEVLADLVKRQHPFATILGCSDSRVPPELIFDAKFGDLFVVRVAGNAVSPEIWGSFQYASTHLQDDNCSWCWTRRLRRSAVGRSQRNSMARRSVRASVVAASEYSSGS